MVTHSTLPKGEDTIAEEEKKVLKWGSKNDMGSPEVPQNQVNDRMFSIKFQNYNFKFLLKETLGNWILL